MNGKVTSDVLANFFDDLDNGSSTLETYQDGHPDMAGDLGSLAEVAQSITAPPEVSLDPLARARVRAGLLYQIAQTERSRSRPPKHRSIGEGLRDLVGLLARVPTAVVAATIVLTTSLSGGVVFASEGALPGDALYPVRLSFESLQITLAPNDNARAAALVHLAYNRLSDVDKATGQGDVKSVSAAINSYADDVAQASQILSQSTESNETVLALTDRLQNDYVDHEKDFVMAESREPNTSVTRSIDRADRSVEGALALAVARGQYPTPIAKAVPANGGTLAANGTGDATVSVAARTGLVAAAAQPSGSAAVAAVSSGAAVPAAAASASAPTATMSAATPVAGRKPPIGLGPGGHERDNNRHQPIGVERRQFVLKTRPNSPPPASRPVKQSIRAVVAAAAKSNAPVNVMQKRGVGAQKSQTPAHASPKGASSKGPARGPAAR